MTPTIAAPFHPARLAARADVGGGLSLLSVELPSDVARSYLAPGQYVEVRAAGQTGWFVLASEPGAPTWDLIMRSGGGASDVLLTMVPGDRFEVTRAMGDGFPMDGARGRPLLIVLGGTGVAAARPIVRRRLADGDAGKTQLVVAVRTRADLPLDKDLGGWARSGVRVLVCLSQPSPPAAQAPGLDSRRFAHGYVQDVLRARTDFRPPHGAHLFVVGVPSMVEALRDLAPSLGIAPGDVSTNL